MACFPLHSSVLLAGADKKIRKKLTIYYPLTPNPGEAGVPRYKQIVHRADNFPYIKNSFATKVYIGCEALFFKGLCVFLQSVLFLVLSVFHIEYLIA